MYDNFVQKLENVAQGKVIEFLIKKKEGLKICMGFPNQYSKASMQTH